MLVVRALRRLVDYGDGYDYRPAADGLVLVATSAVGVGVRVRGAQAVGAAQERAGGGLLDDQVGRRAAAGCVAPADRVLAQRVHRAGGHWLGYLRPLLLVIAVVVAVVATTTGWSSCVRNSGFFRVKFV